MFIANLKMTAAIVVAFCALGTGAGVVWHRAVTASTPIDEQAPPSVDRAPSVDRVQVNKPQAPPKTVLSPEPSTPKRSSELLPPASEPPMWERRLAELREKLEQPVTVEFDTVPIHDVISYLVDRYGLPIVLVPEAFATAAELEVFRQRPVKIEKLAGVELRTVLRFAVNQAKADYQLRDTGLFIFPKEYAASGRLLEQPVSASFHQASLDQALARLAAQTGVSVVLDARAAPIAKVAITADLDNVPLKTAVQILADMAALKPVVMDNALYVTTAANARLLEAERAATPPQHPAPVPKKVKEEAPK